MLLSDLYSTTGERQLRRDRRGLCTRENLRYFDLRAQRAALEDSA